MTRSPRPLRLAPSILSADFVNLERELSRIADADLVHVDVMDNHFVPNLTFGPQMVGRVQAVAPVPLDVHLMIDDADRWAPGYAELGCSSVTFHAEAAADPAGVARALRERGARAGMAIKPDTSADVALGMLAELDLVLVMTVEPGFGGQSFRRDVLPKVRALRVAIDEAGLDVDLEVDGGVDAGTIGEAAEAGADLFVAGSAVYGADDPGRAIADLRTAARAER